MKRMRDAFGVIFQHLIQTAQGRVRVAVSAVGHLERREAFHEELLKQFYGFNAFDRSPRRAQDGLERPVVEHPHIYNSQTLFQGFASQFVRLGKGGFTRVSQVLLHGSLVFPLQRVMRKSFFQLACPR